MRKQSKHAVIRWPDAPGACVETCAGTPAHPGCGAAFGVVAQHAASGRLCGRARCPHCGARRRIPDALHPTYLQWFGLVENVTRKAGARTPDELDAVRDAVHDVYAEALLKWVPGVAKFSTFAWYVLPWAARRALADARKRPAPRRLDTYGPECPLAPEAPDPMEALDEGAARRGRIDAALRTLPERDAAIVRARYGLDGDALTLDALGARFGVTKERVSQICLRAHATLGRLLGDSLNPSTEV